MMAYKNSTYEKGTRYERLVSDILETRFYLRDLSGNMDIDSNPGKVYHKKKYLGKKSGHHHEIDLSFELDAFGISILVLIECKCYKDRAVGVDELLEFAARLDDIGANKGIAIATTGFDRGAVRVAEANGIALVVADYGRWVVVMRASSPPRRTTEDLLYTNIAVLSIADDNHLTLGYCPADLVDFRGLSSEVRSERLGGRFCERRFYERLLFHIVSSGGPSLPVVPDEGARERIKLLAPDEIQRLLEAALRSPGSPPPPNRNAPSDEP